MTWQAIPLRAASIIDSAPDRVRHAVLRIECWQRAATAVGFRLAADGSAPQWRAGQQVEVVRLAGRSGPHHAAVALSAAGLPIITFRSGPAAGGRLTITLEETGAGVLVTTQFAAVDPAIGAAARLTAIRQNRHRTELVWAMRMLLGIFALEMHQTRVVVAGAIIDGHRVLAARRTYPAAAVGRWEFPGGKVGLDETDEQALSRELAEELGVTATVGERIGPEISLDVELVLRLYLVAVGGVPEPARAHDELRWLDADELDELNWLDADRKLLPAVTAALAISDHLGGSLR